MYVCISEILFNIKWSESVKKINPSRKFDADFFQWWDGLVIISFFEWKSWMRNLVFSWTFLILLLLEQETVIQIVTSLMQKDRILKKYKYNKYRISVLENKAYKFKI